MENNKQRKERNERPDKAFNFYWIYGIIGLVILSMWLFNSRSAVQRITVSDYYAFLDSNDVSAIVLTQQEVEVTIKETIAATSSTPSPTRASWRAPVRTRTPPGRTTSSSPAAATACRKSSCRMPRATT